MKALALLVVAACAHPAPAPIVANAAPAPPPTAVACVAPCLPDVPLVDLAGHAVAVAGRVVVVNFWATWAHPSQREIPVLANAHAAYGERVVIIGALVDNASDADVAAFAIPYPIVRATPAIMTAWNYPDAIPATFIYDRTGHEIARRVGPYDVAALAAVIDKALQSR